MNQTHNIQKTLLMILDGWGIGDGSKADVIATTPTPYLDKLNSKYPHSQLNASGTDVGLPCGQMGNSEVGHLNIGSGRVVMQDLPLINKVCEENKLPENAVLVDAVKYAKMHNSRIHLMGLTSAGGVHSSMLHIEKLSEAIFKLGMQEHFLHCFTDGRDTDPQSGITYVAQLRDDLTQYGCKIASVSGRYYAMDRDKNWDRIRLAYNVLVNGEAAGGRFNDPIKVFEKSYAENVFDEYILPSIIVDANNQPIATITDNDVVIFFNFRNDRPKELTIALSQPQLLEKELTNSGFDPQYLHTLNLHFCTMTPYDNDFENVHVLFGKTLVDDTLTQYISRLGLKQLHTAETEKFAHVTFFFNGGRKEAEAGEDRILIPSPKVEKYSMKPEMSAFEVTDSLTAALKEEKYDFVVVNYANGDMVGHTDDYQAKIRAVEVVDSCVEKVVATAQQAGYEVLIIADHGNVDYSLNPDGTPNTAHSTNPVPCILVSERYHELRNGILADVAPTILEMMGVEKPEAMTGNSLIVR